MEWNTCEPHICESYACETHKSEINTCKSHKSESDMCHELWISSWKLFFIPFRKKKWHAHNFVESRKNVLNILSESKQSVESNTSPPFLTSSFLLLQKIRTINMDTSPVTALTLKSCNQVHFELLPTVDILDKLQEKGESKLWYLHLRNFVLFFYNHINNFAGGSHVCHGLFLQCVQWCSLISQSDHTSCK